MCRVQWNLKKHKWLLKSVCLKLMEMWTLSLPMFSMMTRDHSHGLVSIICRPALGPALTFCSSGWCWCPIRSWTFSLLLGEFVFGICLSVVLLSGCHIPSSTPPYGVDFPTFPSLFWCPALCWLEIHAHTQLWIYMI